MSVPIRWESEPVPVLPEPTPLRRRKPRRSRALRPLLALALCSGTVAVAAAQARDLLVGRSTPALTLSQTAPSSGQVALTTSSAERRLGYVTVVGDVQNRTGRALPRVEAVVELLDSAKQTLQVESALIAFDPLTAGEAAPFRVELPDNACAVSYRVRFKQMLGGRVD